MYLFQSSKRFAHPGNEFIESLEFLEKHDSRRGYFYAEFFANFIHIKLLG